MDNRQHNMAVSAGALSPTIWIGRLNKARTAFLDGKQDATDMVLRAVAMYTQKHFGGALKAEYSDFDIEVRVTPKEANSHSASPTNSVSL